MEKYSDDADIADEYDDILPSPHTYVALWQLSLEYVNHFILVLNQLNLVGYQNEQRRQWETRADHHQIAHVGDNLQVIVEGLIILFIHLMNSSLLKLYVFLLIAFFKAHLFL